MASTRLVALCGILVITVINVFSVKLTTFLQKIFFMGKFLAAGMVVLMSLYSVTFGDTQAIAKENFQLLVALPDDWSWSFGYIAQYFAQFGIATIAALWAYDGFTNLNHVAEEIIHPQKNIPRSIIIAVLIVIATYLFVNVAYLLVLTKEEIIASQTIAVTIAKRVWGNVAANIVALLVSFSAFGTLSGSLFTGSRVFYAGAKDSLMPFAGFFSLVSVWFETPYTAIILSSIMASSILMLGDFANLINYFGFAAWIFYGLCAVALIYVRQKKKHIFLPFKVRPYPIIPVLFILAALAVIVSALIQSPAFTLIAFSLIIFAIPFYYIFCWRDGRIFGNFKQQVLRLCGKHTVTYPDLEGKEEPIEYPMDDFTPDLGNEKQ